ncbi:MAG: DUF1573 domain-containing protein [Bacteroidia bacterium]|nr:DUF1573 domain-containing protein [Bacteroidia bacterium]MDW8301093.1 DUF1573 domain-containing protein [Bacteroidia bacterium]
MFSIYAQNNTSTITSVAPPSEDAGELSFEEETYDFGTITQKTAPNNKISHEFFFTNTGKKPVKISQVTASCGCTTPRWSSEPIPPGKKGSILVEYDASRLGSFHKAITITSDAKTPSKVIFIKGVVEQPAATSPLIAPGNLPKL